ncbi:MAG: SAV_6107 family HEPN domain-containing protein [Mycobacteriales bacterium]
MTAPVLPASTLLSLSQRGLAEAAATTAPGQRYALAHLAALRAAAAVLSCRATPAGPQRGRPKSAWVLLAAVAPELVEWAQFFAAGARKRAAAEAGLAGVVTPREADDLLRDAQAFLSVVETTLLADQELTGTGPARLSRSG